MLQDNSKATFHDLTVMSFESRMALPMQRLIEKHGGKPFVAPSMKEIPLEDNQKTFDFFSHLKQGLFDLVIFMTGVGVRTLLSTLETRYTKEEILATLSTQTKIVVRGPKPRAVCKINHIPIAVQVPEPNTWREILALLSEKNLLAGKNVAVLEYGTSNKIFLEELRANGARVEEIAVYKWGLPDDVGPLNQAIDHIVTGYIDLILFTSANQIDNVLFQVRQRNLEFAFRRALHRIGIVSIGPVCSERLIDHQIFPDLEALPNKMDEMVEQAAQRSREILQKKRTRAERAWVRLEGTPHPTSRDLNSPLLRACHLEKNTTIPIWLMRQAGRYMTEYQLIRNRASFMEVCKTPELVAQVTLDAIERLGVDAAIIFSDILLIAEPMGFKLNYQEGLGPVIENPIRDGASIQALKPVMVCESMNFLLEAIRHVRKNMKLHIPLIGFCGAPFTVASYLIEGKSSRNFIPTKTLMHSEPQSFEILMEKLVEVHIDYLNAQIEAGAQVVQIFDSWAGALSADEYRQYVLPHSTKLIQGIKQGTPVIHFGTGTAAFLKDFASAGGAIVSVDWKISLYQAWEHIGPSQGIQGNLDPALLFSKPQIFLPHVEKILRAADSHPGFIFNLGHGILPETPVDHVMALVDYVHEWAPPKIR